MVDLDAILDVCAGSCFVLLNYTRHECELGPVHRHTLSAFQPPAVSLTMGSEEGRILVSSGGEREAEMSRGPTCWVRRISPFLS